MHTIIALLITLFSSLYHVSIFSMERPVGKKQEKTTWFALNYPETETCRTAFQLTDQNTLSLLRAIEDQNIAHVKKYAASVNLNDEPCPYIMVRQLEKETRDAGDTKKANKYADILSILKTIRDQQPF